MERENVSEVSVEVLINMNRELAGAQPTQVIKRQTPSYDLNVIFS